MQQETPEGSQPAPPVPRPAPELSQPDQPQDGSFYHPATPTPYAVPSAPASSPYYAASAAGQTTATRPTTLSWEASEYAHTTKGGLWLAVFGVIVAIFLAIAIWLQVWTFLGLILVMAVAVVVFAFRPPHVLHYTLTASGIQIGDKIFNFSDYRAFGVLEDGAFFTLTLIPIKRFSPALSVYFSEEQGEQIVDIVGEHLPMEHIEPDIIDRISRRLHF